MSLHPKLYAACKEACKEMHDKEIQTHMTGIKVLSTNMVTTTSAHPCFPLSIFSLIAENDPRKTIFPLLLPHLNLHYPMISIHRRFALLPQVRITTHIHESEPSPAGNDASAPLNDAIANAVNNLHSQVRGSDE